VKSDRTRGEAGAQPTAVTSGSIAHAVLAALGSRPVGHRYQRPELSGYSREQIDAAVEELRDGGYVVAAHVPQTPEGTPAHTAPSILTDKGKRLLNDLQTDA
jgi:hypothetical protein